ncbi:MAG: CoA transferase [Rhodospirillaceae bacterium]|jgi:crotonobetainyl-CoA:carnitine CoA-transferase CaiB-like acyl-CoA transferase|nr:CoA transferase [Rhodospirillaceae bacterium]MBT3910373.1 CoA transferase [Rhodospirillaceae bacterium]MBT5297016.1 CoA transferase [Rhodospirillaceae bacterium]MBT5516254.1 CoA transferase [Rhodospirillaceae bacterium]MBT6085275.1 CoA transferase [Rhodospirillaceae bacterium]
MSQGEDQLGLPLDGIRVADFSRLLPGPWCAQFLSDLGASVIKVEIPGTGDMSRHNPPRFGDTSVYFNSVNGGKRGMTLDMTLPEGREIAHRLIETSDVVIESFRPGVAKKLGIDYETVKHVNDRAIYCSITGFGQDGPLAHISGHDLAIQSLAGFMTLGTPDGDVPQVPGFQAADYAGAALACIGILSGLMSRGQHGKGCNIDLSMFDSLLAMCNITLTGAMAKAAGDANPSLIEAWGGNPRYANYATRDGKAVAVALLETRLWRGFCDAIGRPDLVDDDESPDARHSDHGERAVEYRAAISDYCLSKDRDELIDEMVRHGVPLCPIYTPEEAMGSEIVQARGLIEYVENPQGLRIPRIVNPLIKSGLVRKTRAPAPALGADGDAILSELGFDGADLSRFANAGIISS